MASTRVRTWFERSILFSITLTTALASEFHGTTKSNSLPFPGVTVTATQGEKKVVTTSDLEGVFSFKDLADGAWTIEAEMLGCEKASKQVTVAAGAAALDLVLKMLSEDALLASLNSGLAPA